jgi:hypothetical protein
MGGFGIIHWILVIWITLSLAAIPLLLAYRLGKKSGDQEGYLRGYKEGQAAAGR